MTIPFPAPGPAPAADEPARLHVLGNILTFLLRSAATDGAFSLVDCETLPGGGTPPHVQDNDDEAFLVLQGRYAFTLDGTTVSHGPGGFVRVRKGQVHAFANVGSGRARMLILNWPGGLHEGFFDAIGEVLEPGQTPQPGAPDMPRILAAAQAAGIQILPPA
jgi:mannose-6-phosphate isomerase-like protein (cupin superfamily)